MEKKVYCLFDKRCKCIRYQNRPNETDVDAVGRALVESKATDTLLQATMQGKIVVLQRPDPDRNNRLCDIEIDEEIPDKDEVSVLFVEAPSQKEIAPITANINFFKDDSIIMDLPIINIYEESGTTTEMITTNPSDANVKPNTTNLLDLIESATEENGDANVKPTTSNSDLVESASGETGDANVKPTTSKSDLVESATGGTARRHHEEKKSGVPYPAYLPKLTPALQKLLQTVGVFNGVKDFIYFWASHLLNITDNTPTKQDYHNYALTIVDTYPALKGGSYGCGIVRTQLSTHIRNRRANLKKKLLKRNANGEPKGSTNFAIMIEPEQSTGMDVDMQTAMVELGKKGRDVDSAHVKRLLKETFPMRRSWIEKEAKEISEITTKFPQLLVHDLIVFEFISMKKVNMESIDQSLDTFIKSLATYYNIEGITEAGKAAVMLKLYESLAYSKTKKKVTPLFIIKPMMGSTENLFGAIGDSPRAVLYTAEERIASAYIVADADIRVKISEPTVAKSVCCLVAAYYVWDTEYPLAYSKVMELLDHQILGTAIKHQTTQRFLQKMNHSLKTTQE